MQYPALRFPSRSSSVPSCSDRCPNVNSDSQRDAQNNAYKECERESRSAYQSVHGGLHFVASWARRRVTSCPGTASYVSVIFERTQLSIDVTPPMAASYTRDRFANLDELLRNDGSYLIGDTKSLRGVAIASDSQVVYATLKRRDGETLETLHERR